MTSLGVSPTFPSLLIPPNPSFSSIGSTPSGGILRNARRESDVSCPPSPAFGPMSLSVSSPVFKMEPDSPEMPVSPIDPIPNMNINSAASPQPRIRFAPLPDPRRPRSLSTGDGGWATEEEGELADLPGLDAKREPAVVEYDESAIEEEDGSDMDELDKKSRRWSKSMGMGMGMGSMGSMGKSLTTVPGWRGTKKLLGMKEEKKEEVYSAGAPLKKSVSTGNASVFKMSLETERRRTMQGPLSIPSSSRLEAGTSPGHRRNSSLEPAASTSLGTSPGPVKMLNGRVYGSRRASEAAKTQAELRAKNEPAFVEWGNNTTGGLGSVAPKGKSLLADDDDGSGMEWVKRRREERRRQQQAEAAAKANATSDTESRDGLTSGASSASHSPISPAGTHLVTPHSPEKLLPPTPVIHITEHGTSPTEPVLATSAASKIEDPREHITQAIQMPQRNKEGRDVFDDGNGSSEEEEEDEDEDEDGEEESDGDFDDDDEEEEDANRTTCTAAGVEVVSRHKESS